ncbi:hypothetical protein HDU93_008592 [Gonapodya sp. JEL0774]|nr:hypothetical protein HDU93_008592 [Gonapodya sp. JEL0774]
MLHVSSSSADSPRQRGAIFTLPDEVLRSIVLFAPPREVFSSNFLGASRRLRALFAPSVLASRGQPLILVSVDVVSYSAVFTPVTFRWLDVFESTWIPDRGLCYASRIVSISENQWLSLDGIKKTIGERFEDRILGFSEIKTHDIMLVDMPGWERIGELLRSGVDALCPPPSWTTSVPLLEQFLSSPGAVSWPELQKLTVSLDTDQGNLKSLLRSTRVTHQLQSLHTLSLTTYANDEPTLVSRLESSFGELAVVLVHRGADVKTLHVHTSPGWDFTRQTIHLLIAKHFTTVTRLELDPYFFSAADDASWYPPSDQACSLMSVRSLRIEGAYPHAMNRSRLVEELPRMGLRVAAFLPSLEVLECHGADAGIAGVKRYGVEAENAWASFFIGCGAPSVVVAGRVWSAGKDGQDFKAFLRTVMTVCAASGVKVLRKVWVPA